MGGKDLQLQVKLPSDKYAVTWIEPLTGNTLSHENITVHNSVATLIAPSYKTDIALKIIKQQ